MRTGPLARPPLVALAVALVLAVAATLAALPSCGGDDDGDRPPSSTTTPSTTSAEDATKAEVEAAYTTFVELSQRLTANPDPTDPQIDDVATGDVKDALINTLNRLQNSGRAIVVGDRTSSNVLSVDLVDQNTAVVRDCAVDDSQVIDVATGDVISEGLATGIFPVTLTHDGDQWRVSEAPDAEETWDGVAGCAID
ncbi:MAG TPA: hypothetical protein VK306_14005 [Acidimicrobiales bacterium]|nr:hypothetical protein [Acidimicrobiales bacterium]